MTGEIIEPENGRYRADLLFLHGLWTTAEIFRPAVLGFAHRGWRCEMLDLRAEGPADALDVWCERVVAHVEAAERPVILVGHDAGALVALAAAERAKVSAVIASAPLLGGAPRVHPALPVWWARVRGGEIPPPLPDHAVWSLASRKGRARLDAALVDESARLTASAGGALGRPGRPCVPALLLGYEDDALAPRHLVEISAQGIEAEFAALPGGHYAMLEEPWDSWMSQVQRWLIRVGGDALLELRGDEDLDPDALI